jgi:Alpha-L-arabinofuranosidase B (ABFB) domain
MKGHSGSGVSLAPASQPTRSLRQYQNALYVARNGGPNAFDTTTGWAADTSFAVSSGWWHSDVDVAPGPHSFQPTTAGYTTYSLRHVAFLAQIAQLTASSGTTDRQDATFTIVPGLADSSCYSFRSANYPTRFLRHYDYRLRLDVNDSSGPLVGPRTPPRAGRTTPAGRRSHRGRRGEPPLSGRGGWGDRPDAGGWCGR